MVHYHKTLSDVDSIYPLGKSNLNSKVNDSKLNDV